MAVNTQLCLSASEEFDFHLTARRTGVWRRQKRAWVVGREAGERRREKLCRARAPCVGRLSHGWVFSPRGHSVGEGFWAALG